MGSYLFAEGDIEKLARQCMQQMYTWPGSVVVGIVGLEIEKGFDSIGAGWGGGCSCG